jgi:hypothetical protein
MDTPDHAREPRGLPRADVRERRPRRWRIGVGALITASLAVASWYGWLGWDHEYQTDPATGVASGPYEPWQVIGCVLTLIGVSLGAAVLSHPLVPVAVIPLAFTVTWSLDASRQDETGLWGVGALLVFAGTLVGTAVVAAFAAVLRHIGATRRGVAPR